jgi:hypothetical protein
MNDIQKPNLIESGIKGFYIETLKKCHKVREKYYNVVFNLSIFFVFICIVGCILIYKYKGKLTNEEKIKKDEEKKNYIISKLRCYQNTKLKEQQALITGLPYIGSDFQNII